MCFDVARFFGVSPQVVLDLPHSERELWTRQALRINQEEKEAADG